MNKKRLTSLLLSTTIALGVTGTTIAPAITTAVSAAGNDTQTATLSSGSLTDDSSETTDFSKNFTNAYGSWNASANTFTLSKNVVIDQYDGVSYQWLFNNWNSLTNKNVILDLAGNTLTVNSYLQTVGNLKITGGAIESGDKLGVKNSSLTNPLDYGLTLSANGNSNNRGMGLLNVNSLLNSGYILNTSGNAVLSPDDATSTTNNVVVPVGTPLSPATLTLDDVKVTASGKAVFAVTIGGGDNDSWSTASNSYAANPNTGNLIINNCVITAESGVKAAVGVLGVSGSDSTALFSTNKAQVNIQGNSQISAVTGRALSVANSAGDTTVSVQNSVISNDENSEKSAIYFSGTGTGTFTNAEITGSVAIINIFGRLTFEGSETVVKSTSPTPLTGPGTVVEEESVNPAAIVQITNTSKGIYPADEKTQPGVIVKGGNFWTSMPGLSPLRAVNYDESKNTTEVPVSENSGTIIAKTSTGTENKTIYPLFSISESAYFNNPLLPGYLYQGATGTPLQWNYLIDSGTAATTPSYQYSYSDDLKAAMQQVITAGAGEVSSTVTTDTSNTAVFEVNGKTVAKIAVDGTLDLPVNITVNNGSQQITGWTISSPTGLSSSISGNVLTWPAGISETTITLVPVLSSTTTPGGGSNSGTTTPDQKPEETPTPSTPVDTPITDSGSNSDSFKPNSGVNAGVTGEGAGFTTNGSSTQTNETAKTETTFTQNENGTKAASTQNSTGEVTSSVITVPSSSIVNGEADVSLGSNSNTGDELFVVGNKTSETAAPSLTINLPSATTEATVNVTVQNGTMKPGTVAMVEDANGKLVPIPNTTTDGNTLSIPLTGSQKVVIMDNAKTFADTAGVPSYATNAAAYVSARDLMTGMGTAEPKPFSFDTNLTRGQFATVLYRLEGEPKGSGTYPEGIIPGAWNADAARWAVQMGLMGQGGAAFNPQGDITREQIIAILWRLQNKPIVSDSKLDGYNDVDQIQSDDFKQAMAWAVSIGIVGQGTDNLDPNSDASRAEIAAMIQRFIQAIY